MLSECFGSTKFGRARTRLCIPSFDGRYGETYIFKTPHHPDFTRDAEDRMTKVAMATAAAPTFFRPFEDAGYTFVDGGLFANNPIMVALADALSCFSVPREHIRILSIGYRFEVVGEQVMLLLPLVGDDLLRHAAKGIEIPFRAGADELLQQLPVGPDSLPVSLSGTNSERLSIVVPYPYGFFHGIRKVFRNPPVSLPGVATGRVVAFHN